MNNNKLLSHWFGRCLIITVTAFVMDDSVAARKNKNRTQVSTRALLQKVKERDAMIKDLLSRVEALENNRSETAVTRQEPLANNEQSSPAPQQPANADIQPDKSSSQPQAKTGEPAEAPGEFKVDLQASQRALERTLAKSGVLLLPTWYLDTDLNFTFTHRENQNFVLSRDSQGHTISLASGKLRQNIFDPSIGFRLGLPFDSQLEFSLPYRFINQSKIMPSLAVDDKANGSGLGDVQIGLAKTLLQEDKWWPDLIARVRWNTDSGEASDGNVRLGGGIHSITGSLSMLKRQDPLAFFLNASYTKSFTKKDYFTGANGLTSSYNPGDTLDFSFGAQLAASADTSLSFSLDQFFVSNQQQGSQTIAGSNQNIAMLSVGASSIISRNFFINLSVGMGLTSDAPDYTAGITISNRTNLKPYLSSNQKVSN
jgi:hypothetical protein